MRNKLVGFLKRPLIQKKIDPFPRRQFAGLSLTLSPLRSSTFFGNSVTRGQLRKVALMTVGLSCGNGLRYGTLGGSHRTRF